MKKTVLTLLAFLALASQAFAVPAKPGRFSYTEPDGTVRQLERHGDEFFHWTTDANTGQVVELDMAGYYRPSQLDSYALRQAQEFRRQANQFRQSVHAAPAFNFGERHIPVLLVEFQDVPFSVKDPRTSFDKLLNQRGYSDFQATGSVVDYFLENSHDLFYPVFDVFGPVTLPHEMAYYGGGKSVNSKAAQAVIDAAEMLDSQIDFSRYDVNNDGAVDMMLMYYAGYSEAEGGPEDSIWPHQWNVNSYKSVYMDGKLLSRYFCTAELRGNTGSRLCSIGATCHEFSHALGLPDFYDTDGEENGNCAGLGQFSLMCSGCYNNDARTPPFFNALERVMLGWMDPGDIRELPDGETRFGSVSENVAYKSLTDIEGEYFIYECRDGYSWDTPLPTGMLVFHVDQSPWRSLGGMPLDLFWEKWSRHNQINAFGNHPCYYVVPAAAQWNLAYDGKLDAWVFPGSSRVTEFHPKDWDGNDSGVSIFDIRYDNSEAMVSLTTENHYSRELRGTVLSLDGTPIPGVYIRLSEPGTRRLIPAIGTRSVTPTWETTTADDGTFALDVRNFGDKVHLSAFKSGFYTYEQDVDLLARITPLDFHMRRHDEGGENWIYLYNPYEQLWSMSLLQSGTEMAASLFSASVLNDEAGRLLTHVQYYINAKSIEEFYIIIDDAATGERLLTYPVKDYELHTDVRYDVSDAGFVIPAGKDLLIGYAIKGADTPYPFIALSGGNNFYSSEYNLEKSRWVKDTIYGVSLLVCICLNDSDQQSGGDDAKSLSELGYNSIDPGTGTYKAGENFQLQLVQAPSNPPADVRWFWDGEEKTGAKSVSLTAGEHVVEALLIYADGSREVLELPLKVQ